MVWVLVAIIVVLTVLCAVSDRRFESHRRVFSSELESLRINKYCMAATGLVLGECLKGDVDPCRIPDDAWYLQLVDGEVYFVWGSSYVLDADDNLIFGDDGALREPGGRVQLDISVVGEVQYARQD